MDKVVLISGCIFTFYIIFVLEVQRLAKNLWKKTVLMISSCIHYPLIIIFGEYNIGTLLCGGSY